jgi:hypothetical protein
MAVAQPNSERLFVDGGRLSRLRVAVGVWLAVGVRLVLGSRWRVPPAAVKDEGVLDVVGGIVEPGLRWPGHGLDGWGSTGSGRTG